MLKTRFCGDLGSSDVGATVELAGWVQRRRDHGGLIFVDLRDSHGVAQAVFNPEWSAGAHATADQMRGEYVVWARGEVVARSPETVNPRMATGAIEVHATEARILNTSQTPPFYISDDADVEELLRLRYRYLDLRRPSMQRNLVFRSRVVKYIRDFLSERGFVEVETPILLASTPEGARDYLVPSRVHPGSFYALPQSPQQLKQLLMVAGLERYFQIARCFRDEDLRADRQPEFTQLDLEMSFVDENDVLDLTEELYTGLTATMRPDLTVPSPFARMTYEESMRRFGTDKPDLRFGMELFTVDDVVAGSEFAVFRGALEAHGQVRGICLKGGASMSRRQIDELTDLAKSRGARGLVTIAVDSGAQIDALTVDDVRSPAARYLRLEEIRGIAARAGAAPGDIILLVADRPPLANAVLDVLRRELAERAGLVDHGVLTYSFITDFPLFEWNEGERRWDSSHHPFTAPRDEDIPLLDSSPGEVRSKAYDLACNGWELGSGSIRIHETVMQARIFSMLGIIGEEQEQRFGHMLEAFRYGAPPHGGIAPGIDRTVAILLGETDIREVIAFPKTKSAADVMTGAPSPVPPAQLRELHIALTPD
ncbi:MAG TPA: aspartate--tRNA ligase [Dehalococcoidia bacterium]|nr:aspartate--tRNA ligase [Dehalococcoidia bacterium]